MRTHVFGWVILALAVFAPPWDAPERPHPIDKRLAIAPSVAGAPGTHRAAPAPGVTSSIETSSAVAGPDLVDGAAPHAMRGVPAYAPTQRPPEPVADAARPFVASPAFAVREFAPGSKGHSAAIAENIASEEFQDVVTPLARLYLAYFGRVPDYEGLDYYTGERDRGEPLEAVADEFAGSAEFTARYGSLDNATFVDRVFQNVFDGPGDAAQRSYWIAQLESGSMTRGQVMLAFSESPAFRAATGNEVFVAIAYAQTLGRAPDPADLSRWVRFLDAGNPRPAVIEGLLADRGKR